MILLVTQSISESVTQYILKFIKAYMHVEICTFPRTLIFLDYLISWGRVELIIERNKLRILLILGKGKKKKKDKCASA